MDEDLVPKIAKVEEVRAETPDIRSLKLVFEDPALGNSFEFRPGQFCLISVLGVGESAFCIASSPTWKDFFEVSVKEVGKVTSAIHDLEVGDNVGVRGPYGNHFPYEDMFGRNIIFAGGGIGLAPLRPLIWQMISERERFKDVLIICGARSAADIMYKNELAELEKRDDLRLVRTVDPGGENETWDGEVGVVPQILERAAPSPDSLLVTCGPPIMIKFVMLSARRLGIKPSDVITTLEMKMKCGVGLCGRCNVGNRYVCKDGPVFTFEEIHSLPDEF